MIGGPSSASGSSASRSSACPNKMLAEAALAQAETALADAECALKNGDTQRITQICEEVQEALSRAADFLPTNPQIRDGLSLAYYGQGDVLSRLGREDEARHSLAISISLSPREAVSGVSSSNAVIDSANTLRVPKRGMSMSNELPPSKRPLTPQPSVALGSNASASYRTPATYAVASSIALPSTDYADLTSSSDTFETISLMSLSGSLPSGLAAFNESQPSFRSPQALLRSSTPNLEQGQQHLDEGDKYVNQWKFDKARKAYEEAKRFLPTEAEARLALLPAKQESLAATPLIPRLISAWVTDTWAKVRGHLNEQPREQRHHAPRCFRSDEQAYTPLVVNPPLISSFADIQHTKELVDCFNALLKEPDQHNSLRETLRSSALALIQVFDQSSKTEGEIGEIVHLGTCRDPEIYSELVRTLVKEVSGPLPRPWATQSLGVIFNAYPFEIGGDMPLGINGLRHIVSVLPLLLDYLDRIPLEKNAGPLKAALTPLTELLDLLVCAGISGINENIYKRLDDRLNKLSSHSDEDIAYQARYTQQALAYIDNNQSIKMTIAEHTAYGGMAAATLASGIVKLDPSRLQKVYSYLQKAIPRTLPQAWYAAVRYAKALAKAQQWQKFEDFVRLNDYATNASFLQGICFLLEEIALTYVHTNKLASDGAKTLLKEFDDYAIWWSDCQVLQQAAQRALDRIDTLTIYPTEGRSAGVSWLDAPPVWHSYWKSIPDNILLKKIQSEAQREKIIDGLPDNIIQSKQWVVKTLLEKLQITNIRAANSRYQLPAVLGAAEDIQKLHDIYLHNLQSLDEVQNALALYTPTEGSISASSDQRFPLQDKIEEFLGSDKQVLLLLGEAGAGKSTFNRHLTNVLWERYSQAPESGMPIPLFIALAEYPPTGGDLIATYLEKQGFEPETIRTLRKRHFVFILDGFDEIKDRAQSLHIQTQIYNWTGKIIVSARPEYLNGRHEDLFQQRGQTTALEQCWITPISDNWMRGYSEKYVQINNPSLWSPARYQAALAELPTEVRDTIRRPFLFRMALELLPSLSTNNATHSLTRIGLYDAFLEQWWERSEKRLKRIRLNEAEKNAWEKLQPYLNQDGLFICEDMAVSLQKEKLLYASFERQRGQNQATPAAWNRYFSEDAESRLLLFNAPLLRENNRYKFIHKSIQDYLVARNICGPAFEASEPQIEATLNQFSIVNEPLILDFLVERIQQQPLFKAHLWKWLEASKNPELDVAIGAANAATILARANESFSGKDLRGIRIPYANLSHSICDGTHFEETDLTEVIFFSAWLRNAQFDRAQMQGVQFGQEADIQLFTKSKSLYYSPNERYILRTDGTTIERYNAEQKVWHNFIKTDVDLDDLIISANSERALVKEENGALELYSLRTQERLISVNHGSKVRKIALSEDGQLFASKGADNFIKVWSTKKTSPLRIFTSNDYDPPIAISNKHKIIAFRQDKKIITVASLESALSFDLPHEATIEKIALSENGQWIVAGEWEQHIYIWSLKTKIRERILKHDELSKLTISPNNQWIASANLRGSVKLWSLETGKCTRTFSAPTWVQHIQFSENGHTLHTIAQNTRDADRLPNLLQHWPFNKLERSTVSSQISHPSMDNEVLSPDAQWIAFVDENRELWLYATDRSSSQKIGKAKARYGDVIFSRDNQWLAWLNESSHIACRSLKERDVEHSFAIGNFKEMKMAFSIDSRQLIIINAEFRFFNLYAYSLETKTLIKQGEIRRWSPSYNGVISLWDAESLLIDEDGFRIEKKSIRSEWGEEVWPPSVASVGSKMEEDDEEYIFDKSAIFVGSFVLSPNRKWLGVTDDCDGHPNDSLKQIQLFSLERKQIEYLFSTATTENIKFAFSPDEEWLAVAEYNRLVFYALVSERPPYILEHGLTNGIKNITWQHDKILTTEKSGNAYLWQVNLSRPFANDFIQLSWKSSPAALTLEYASVDKTKGLTSADIALFKQFDATGTPASLSLPADVVMQDATGHSFQMPRTTFSFV